MYINITDIVPIIIVFQSFLFAIVLLTDTGQKKVSNRYLAAFLLLLGTQFFVVAGNSFGLNSNFISSNICVFGFCYGPLLFLYSKSLIYKSFQFQFVQLLHFILAVIILLSYAFGYPLCGSLGIFMYLSLLIYIALAIKEIMGYRKIIGETQSSIDRTDLLWLQWTMIIFCFALILDIMDQYIGSLNLVPGISSTHLSIAVLINWMFYKGLKQPQIFLGITNLDEEVYKDKKNIGSQKNPDDDEQAELDHIKKFMEDNEIYTNPQLGLKELSEHLKITPRRLSYLINTFCNQNFMGFVNDYRIEKAKFRFKTPKEQGETISEIMYEVGFNSKSSFNTIFKEKTGFTPSEFKKKDL